MYILEMPLLYPLSYAMFLSALMTCREDNDCNISKLSICSIHGTITLTNVKGFIFVNLTPTIAPILIRLKPCAAPPIASTAALEGFMLRHHTSSQHQRFIPSETKESALGSQPPISNASLETGETEGD
jgi:hypothetical protein